MEEKYIYYNNLYDIYEDLLTDKEKQVFKDYYQEDLSLSEIADNKSISKSAVGKMLKNILEKLENLEDKLHIYKNNQELVSLLEEDNIDIIKKNIKKILNS